MRARVSAFAVFPNLAGFHALDACFVFLRYFRRSPRGQQQTFLVAMSVWVSSSAFSLASSITDISVPASEVSSSLSLGQQ